jgi:hypothetical protein
MSSRAWFFAGSWYGLFCVAWVLGAAGVAAAQGVATPPNECPYVLLSRGVTMEIAEIKYVESVQGVDGNTLKMPAEQIDKFRLGVVTVRVEKPTGKRLAIAAADLTLHYNHGQSQEVSPCEGLSTFTRQPDEERPVKLFKGAGPGWIKQTTGLRATEASEIYFDAIFHLVEPDIREVWLCVGQPSTPKAFPTAGWTPKPKEKPPELAKPKPPEPAKPKDSENQKDKKDKE